MRSCHVLVVLAALLLAACGTESSGPKYAGFEAKGIKAVEPSQAGQEIGQRLEAVKGRKPEATKDEAPPVPAATRFFRLTEAFEGTGFLPQSLKHEVAEEVVAGKVPYVKVTSYEGKPEVAYIFDSFNNETNRVQYVWDDRYNVIAGEYQNRTGAMLKKYLFCPREEGRIDVHELDSFRVHKAYTQRVVLGENRITVSYLDGHDPRGGLPLWPECKELDPIADQARGYESPWGTAKMEFVFSGKGELLVAARYNAAGQLDSDYQGISKRELKWDDAGQLLEELDYDDATAIYRVIYTRANGLLAERKILSPEGAPRADYLGVATYGYAYDTAGRVETETRTGADGQVLGSVKFAYNRKGYVTEELHLDGTGAIQRSLVHQYDKKGLRTELAVFRGAAADAVRMLDENRVAVYRWAYDKEGQLLVQSHHGLDEVDTPEGRSFRLVNDLKGVAKITWGEDRTDKDHLKKFEHTTTVDDTGEPVKEKRFLVFVDTIKNEAGEAREETRAESWLFRWTRENGAVTGGTEALLNDEDREVLVRTVDAAQQVTGVMKVTWGGNGLVAERAWFDATGEGPAVNGQGAHKQAFTYNSWGKLGQEILTDLNGRAILTKTFEYSDEGVFQKVVAVDADGRPVAL